MDPAVSVQGLCVTYRRRLRSPAVCALDHLDLEAGRGEIVGVLGPNGSGKTSLLQVLSGSLAPTAGSARILGLGPADRQLVPRVGYQPEGPLPFPMLSAWELLGYLGDMMRLPTAETRQRTETWLERFGLQSAAHRPIGTYSTGMARRLAVAAALLSDPEVLLLDEPTSGIDPDGSLTVLEVLQERARSGGTVVMTSHHLQEVERTCRRVYLLEAGRCRAHGDLDELLGTGDRTLVLRGLDDEGLEAVRRSVAEHGGEVVEAGKQRQHLFALFRSLRTRASPNDREDHGAS